MIDFNFVSRAAGLKPIDPEPTKVIDIHTRTELPASTASRLLSEERYQELLSAERFRDAVVERLGPLQHPVFDVMRDQSARYRQICQIAEEMGLRKPEPVGHL